MLFEEHRNFQYTFPEPQYLGAKVGILERIQRFIPEGVEKALDGFSGSQSVSYLFKQLGYTTFTNDFLNFNNQIGIGIIENKNDILTESDILLLQTESDEKKSLIIDNFEGLFFGKEDCIFLEHYRINITKLSNKYKQGLAFATINRAMTRKVLMGHFAHTQATIYAKDNERIKRNPSIARPLIELWKEIVGGYNDCIFDNTKENKSFHMNISDLLKQDIGNIDLVYYDPPYCNSHADYQSFYHVLETFTNYWEDKEFVNGIKRYDPPLYSGFDKKSSVLSSFQDLFEKSKDIPHWLISRNDRSYPSPEEIKEVILPYKDVTIEYKKYATSRGGKGSVAGSHEVLFVCKPKISVYFNG